GTDSAHLIG
nr:sperm activating peptide III [Clypeaster japonicus]